MLQLVYISTAKAPVDAALLEAILAVSRRNNVKADVTGLLVAGGRRFLQVLEGPDQAVLATYARIQHDPRHKAFVLLSCKQVQDRAFGDWSMAYQAGGDPGETGLREAVVKLTETLEDRTLRAHFTGFAELHAKAA
jgi:hypothetical protein